MTSITDPSIQLTYAPASYPRWFCAVQFSDNRVLHFDSSRLAWQAVPLSGSEAAIRARATADFRDSAYIGQVIHLQHKTITGEPVTLIFTCRSLPPRMR